MRNEGWMTSKPEEEHWISNKESMLAEPKMSENLMY
jgi:hypothetical protein